MSPLLLSGGAGEGEAPVCGWHSVLSLLLVGYKSAPGRGQGEGYDQSRGESPDSAAPPPLQKMLMEVFSARRPGWEG